MNFKSSASGPTAPLRRNVVIYVRRLFPMYAAMLLVDAFRVANFYMNAPVYSWSFTSDDGKDTIESSSGIPISMNRIDHASVDYLFVVAGDDSFSASPGKELPNLRKLSRSAGRVICLDSGLLLAIGLTRNFSSFSEVGAIHPLSAASLEEATGVELAEPSGAKSSRISGSPGGLNTAQVALTLIGNDCGPFVRELARRDMSIPFSLGDTAPDPLFIAACTVMRDNIKNPLTLDELCAAVKTSPRQLNRVFQASVGAAPMRYYLIERLLVARQLALQTSLTITGVALATGFKSQSAFCRAFRDYFEISVSHYVSRMRKSGNEYFLPRMQ